MRLSSVTTPYIVVPADLDAAALAELAAASGRSACRRTAARLVLDRHPAGGGPAVGLLLVDDALARQLDVGADHDLVTVGHGHPCHGVTPAMRTTAAGFGTTTSVRTIARTIGSSVPNAALVSTSTVASERNTTMPWSAA